jgi:hypothetical protein
VRGSPAPITCMEGSLAVVSQRFRAARA